MWIFCYMYFLSNKRVTVLLSLCFCCCCCCTFVIYWPLSGFCKSLLSCNFFGCFHSSIPLISPYLFKGLNKSCFFTPCLLGYHDITRFHIFQQDLFLSEIGCDKKHIFLVWGKPLTKFVPNSHPFWRMLSPAIRI